MGGRAFASAPRRARNRTGASGAIDPDRPRRWPAAATGWLAGLACMAGLALLLPKPMIIYNPSPSIPVGYYIRSAGAPRLGSIIAFHVPKPGLAYAREHIPYVVGGGIIKKIAAVSGDHVCCRHRLVINGRVWGPVATIDRNGDALPHWGGCRALGRDEYFVVSTRIPNSFDSRYYGPVSRSDVIGSFRPLWTDAVP